MADIAVSCPKCEAVNTVSEFVDESTLRCRSCGDPLKKPTETPGSQPRRKLGFRRAEDEAVDEQGQPLFGARALFRPPPEKKRRRSLWTPGQIAGSWMLFVLFGVGSGFLRYGNVLKPVQMAIMTQYAPIVVAAFLVLIVLKAFQDSMYDGILCLLLPPYALFYLLLRTDDFYLRAVVAGLLVGLGQDAAMFAYVQGASLSRSISTWISSGG